MELEVKEIKSFNDHAFSVAKEQLQKLAKDQLELMELCKTISNTDNLLQTQEHLNKLTGFKNAEMSAKAMGFDKEYKRVLELDKRIAGRLTSESITETGRLKQVIVDDLREQYIEYYSEGELFLKTEMEEIVNRFNQLPYNERAKFVVDVKKQLFKDPRFRY